MHGTEAPSHERVLGEGLVNRLLIIGGLLDAKYLERQEKEVERISVNGHARIPGDFDYAAIPCLSTEEVEKLTKRQPATLKDAGDIPGITPKALLYVYSTLSKRRRPELLGEPSEAELV